MSTNTDTYSIILIYLKQIIIMHAETCGYEITKTEKIATGAQMNLIT